MGSFSPVCRNGASGLVTGEPVIEFVLARGGGLRECLRKPVGLGWECNGLITAGVVYEDWTDSNVEVHIAFDRPITKTFLRAMFAYPFRQLQVNRITGGARSTNDKAILFAERLGFTREAVQRRYWLDSDRILYVMHKDNCPWMG